MRFDRTYGGNVGNPLFGGAQYAFLPREYQPYPPGRQATRPYATIVAVAKANLVDGEYFTIGYNTGLLGHGWANARPSISKVFEFDLVPDGVTPGRETVDVSADTTAVQVATTMAAAINAATAFQKGHLVAVAVSSTVYIYSKIHGHVLTATENVADAGFIATTFGKYVQCANFAAGPARGHMAFDLNVANPVVRLNEEGYRVG